VKDSEVLVKVFDPGRLLEAWQQVRKNAGAAGIDRMTVEEFAQREEQFLGLIHDKLESGTYRFQPARRVLIPKEGTSGMRKLGIPVVMDRIVGVSMHSVLEEIFDPGFTASNFGFRRGRSQHQAIRHLQRLVQEGREWAVAIDLKSFFDEIPHGLMLKLIRRKVADERLVTLIARLLKAGVIVDGEFEKTTQGCPQGSPLSPILSNLVLNELDQKTGGTKPGVLSLGRRLCDRGAIGKGGPAGDGGDDPVSGGRTWACREPGEKPGCTDQGHNLSGVPAPEGKDPGQQQGTYPVQRPSPGTDSQEQPFIDVSSDPRAEHLLARLGRLFRDSGIQIPVQRPRCLDSKPAEVDAAEEMEESPQVPTDHDQGRLRS
jgi:RNA-directed DNA polymerase